MRVLVTFDAFRRCGLERRFCQFPIRGSRLVALLALELGVRPTQGEMRLGMVEARQIGPGFNRMASLASRGPACFHLFHLSLELLAMRILVAPGAGQIREMIGNDFRSGYRQIGRVTFRAGHRQMRSLQWKPASLMLRNGEGGRFESVHCVAGFAPAVVRSRRELSAMNIRVAIRAFVECDFVTRRRPGWNVTLRAGHRRVLAFQRVGACRVHFHIE